MLGGVHHLLLTEKFKSQAVLYSLNLKDVVCATFTSDAWDYSGLFVHVSQVTAKVSRLSEGLAAHGTVEWSHLGVFAEVVSQVATFGELLTTILIFATEV